MFKGIQDILRHSARQERPKRYDKSAKFSALKDPEALLAAPNRQRLIQQFNKQLPLEPAVYATHVTPLLTHLASYVQTLPETQNSYYAHMGGMLDRALERTHIALQIIRQRLLPKGADAEQITTPQLLWLYAIFSAGLLQNIGKLMAQFHVTCYDGDKQALQAWSPVNGPLFGQGAYFDYEFDMSQSDGFKQHCTLLLVRQIMPVAGLNWIASDPKVFAVWLALLVDDARDYGTLGVALRRADEMVLQNDLLRRFLPGETLDHVDDSMLTTHLLSLELPESAQDSDLRAKEQMLIGVDFIKWLYRSLDNETLMINRSPLFMVPGGLLISSDIMKYYSREQAGRVTLQQLQEALSRLGVVEQSKQGAKQQTYMNTVDKTKYQGIVLNKLHMVLPANFMVNHATGPQRYTPEQLALSSDLQLPFTKVTAAGINTRQPELIAPSGRLVQSDSVPAYDTSQHNQADVSYTTSPFQATKRK